jgi:hypothetical protein
MGVRLDPLADSLARLDDPDLWEIEVGVPVFVPHARGDYEVTADDMAVIAAETEKRAKAGTIPVQTLGHRNLAPDADETKQPPVVGFERNFRVGTWQDRPALLCDVYTAKADWDEAKKYPYRSVEYRHRAKVITGVARLKREPWLDVGTLVYDSADGPVTFYAMDAAGTTPELSPEAQAAADQVYRYLCGKYAWMQTCSKKYEAGPGFPSGTNTTLPTEKKKDEDMATANEAPAAGTTQTTPPADDTAVKYAAIEERCKKLEDQNARLIADREADKVDRLLDQLEQVERYQVDRDTEKPRMLAMTEADRQKRAAEIRKYHHRLPGGGEVEVYRGNVEGPVPDTTKGQMEAAVKYATKHQVSYDEAIAAVKAGKS